MTTWTIVLNRPLEEDDKLDLLSRLEGETELETDDQTFVKASSEDVATIRSFCEEHGITFSKEEERH